MDDISEKRLKRATIIKFYTLSPDKEGMKNQAKKIVAGDIIFMSPKQKAYQSGLKNGLVALRYLGMKAYYQFAHVDEGQNFVKNLSLLQNIMLESDTQTLCYDQEQIIQERLHMRPALKSLFFQIKNLNDLPSEAKKEELILASIVKSFLRNCPMIILDGIDEHLSHFQLKLLKKAILLKNEKENTSFLILSKNLDLWTELSDKIIIRKNDGTFQCMETTKKVEKPPVQHKKDEVLVFNNVELQYELKKIG